jgi:protein O-mannosyl-transferase
MSRRAVSAIFCAILLVLVIAVYGPSAQFQFVRLDDFPLFVENPLLHPPTVHSLGQFWLAPQQGLYTPLSYSLWWCVQWFTKGSAGPGIFHIIKILLHAGAAALVFSILLRCIGSRLAAFAGAIVFALHPMQVESVAWIAETNNVLAGVLSLAAIRLWFAFAPSARGPRWIWYSLATACFLLALFAKPIAVVVPLIAMILDMGILHRPARRVIPPLIPWFIAAIVFAMVSRRVQPAAGAELLRRPVIALDALGFYVRHTFWPAHLSIDYARSTTRIWLNHQWIINALIPVAIAVLLWITRHISTQPIVAAAVALVAVIPMLGLIPFSQQDVSTVADRYVYLMMLGPALLVAWALHRAPTWAATVATILLACPLVWLTTVQLQTWRDTSALASHTLAIDPGSVFGNDMAAVELLGDGRARQAIPLFDNALDRDPNFPGLRYDLGNAYLQLAQYDQAIAQYQLAIDQGGPQRWRAMNNQALAYAKIGRTDLAVEELKKILQLDPQNASANQNLRLLSPGVPTR